MSARYRTGETAKAGDRINRQGETGTVICLGPELADYGLDPRSHADFAMIKYDHLGLVCEPTNSEDIDLIEECRNEK